MAQNDGFGGGAEKGKKRPQKGKIWGQKGDF